MSHRRYVALVSAVVVALGAGCGSVSTEASHSANDALASSPTTTTSPTTSTTSTITAKSGEGCTEENKLNSFRPVAPLPKPGEMPRGSILGTIADRRSLKAAVDENTLGLSFRNPNTGDFQGYEIDILHEIADRIIGNAQALDPIPVVTKNKVSIVGDPYPKVDLTASAVSITCERREKVDFTIPYYKALQKVMVRSDKGLRPVLSDGKPLGPTPDVAALNHALAGHRVCATTGSTSKKLMSDDLPDAISVLADTRTDCLVALQEEKVDAILLHDTFLLGFHQQDPNTVILEPPLGRGQYYGIAVHKGNEDLVRFLNALILEMRKRNGPGGLKYFYEKHIKNLTGDVRAPMPVLPAPQWLD